MASESEQADDTSLRHRMPLECRRQGAIERMWDSYRHHVQRNHIFLQLADDVLTRVIFWAPTPANFSDRATSSSAHQWREVAYGLLSLHRMAMDLALSHDQGVNSFGTTLQPSLAPTVPATALRIALTVTHNLMPTILELARSGSSDSLQRQATCRLWLERVKFVIRLVLVSSYWKQIRNKHESNDEAVAGFLRNGGIFYGMEQQVPSVANVQALRFRRQYVGRRTGRRVTSSDEVASNDEQQQNRIVWMRLVLGEVLRLYRPLYWAQAERNETRTGDKRELWTAWIVTLVMEVTSLQCLSGALSRDNPQSQAELRRRRMKLLLYLLRSPAWDRTTEPSVLRTVVVLRRVPLLGKLVEAYLWEWLLYWKHPFVSEEE